MLITDSAVLVKSEHVDIDAVGQQLLIIGYDSIHQIIMWAIVQIIGLEHQSHDLKIA